MLDKNKEKFIEPKPYDEASISGTRKK